MYLCVEIITLVVFRERKIIGKYDRYERPAKIYAEEREKVGPEERFASITVVLL